MTTQADCSIGFKKETTFGTVATPDRFLEFTSESLDFDRTYYQSPAMRPGSRLARSKGRALVKDGGKGGLSSRTAPDGKADAPLKRWACAAAADVRQVSQRSTPS